MSWDPQRPLFLPPTGFGPVNGFRSRTGRGYRSDGGYVPGSRLAIEAAAKASVQTGPVGVIGATQTGPGAGAVVRATSHLVPARVAVGGDDFPDITANVVSPKLVRTFGKMTRRHDAKTTNIAEGQGIFTTVIPTVISHKTRIFWNVMFETIVITVGIYTVANLTIKVIAIHIPGISSSVAGIFPFDAGTQPLASSSTSCAEYAEIPRCHGVDVPGNDVGHAQSNAGVGSLMKCRGITAGCLVDIDAVSSHRNHIIRTRHQAIGRAHLVRLVMGAVSITAHRRTIIGAVRRILVVGGTRSITALATVGVAALRVLSVSTEAVTADRGAVFGTARDILFSTRAQPITALAAVDVAAPWRLAVGTEPIAAGRSTVLLAGAGVLVVSTLAVAANGRAVALAGAGVLVVSAEPVTAGGGAVVFARGGVFVVGTEPVTAGGGAVHRTGGRGLSGAAKIVAAGGGAVLETGHRVLIVGAGPVPTDRRAVLGAG